MLNKINEATELLTTLQKKLIRAQLQEIYKCFVLIMVTFYLAKVITFFFIRKWSQYIRGL